MVFAILWKDTAIENVNWIALFTGRMTFYRKILLHQQKEYFVHYVVGTLIGLQISPQSKRTMTKIGWLSRNSFLQESEYGTKSSLFDHSCDIVLRMHMFVWVKKCVYLCVYIVNIYIYTITMLCMYVDIYMCIYIVNIYIHIHNIYTHIYTYKMISYVCDFN